MFVHIGGDVVVFVKDIIAVLDLERTTTMQATRQFLRTAEEEGFLMTIGDDLPKAFVIVETEFRYQVYLTSIAASTLRRRCENMIQNPQKELSR
jgi:extracellular matrix regulatory protein B